MCSAVKRMTYEFCVPSAAVLCAVAAWAACAWFGLTAAKSPFLLHSQEIQEEQRALLLPSPDSAWEGALSGLPCKTWQQSLWFALWVSEPIWLLRVEPLSPA